MDKYDKKAAARIERSYQTPEIVNQRLRTLAALALVSGESVLDAGCGTGLLLEQEALGVGADGRAEGVDMSDDMLDYARARCAGLAQVGLRQGSIETLPFDDAAFDALSCTQTLLYVDDIERAMREFYRVLKPGGRVAIIETDWSGVIMNSHDQPLTRRIFDAWDLALVNPALPKKLAPMLREFGFGAVRVEAIPVLNAGYREHSFSGGMLYSFTHTARRMELISSQEAEDWLAGVDRIIAAGEYFFCVNRFLFSAVK